MTTTTKELSVIDKLAQLYALQSVDSRIDAIEIMKGELPMEVSDLEDELVGLKTRITRLQANVEEIEDKISKHKINIKESETLIAKYEKQLENVKNNREYDALTKEIELQKLEIQLSEKKIREATAQKEIKVNATAVSQEKYDARSTDLENKKVELEKIIEKTEKEETKLNKLSAKSRKGLDERLLKSYDKIRSSYRNGLAVAIVERGACGGCFNKIPPQMQIEITQRKKIIACEHCGRVLVDDLTAGIEPKPKEEPVKKKRTVRKKK